MIRRSELNTYRGMVNESLGHHTSHVTMLALILKQLDGIFDRLDELEQRVSELDQRSNGSAGVDN